MSISRKRALAYGYELIAVPRSHLKVELIQTREGVSLYHKGRVITKVFLNRSGMRAAAYMVNALGVQPPPMGGRVGAMVSTGLLYRVFALSSLNYKNPASTKVADRLLEEAVSMHRSGLDDN